MTCQSPAFWWHHTRGLWYSGSTNKNSTPCKRNLALETLCTMHQCFKQDQKTHMRVYACACICVCVYTHMRVHTYACTHICVYVRVHTCACTLQARPEDQKNIGVRGVQASPSQPSHSPACKQTHICVRALAHAMHDMHVCLRAGTHACAYTILAQAVFCLEESTAQHGAAASRRCHEHDLYQQLS